MERIWICGSNGRLGKALEHHLNPIDAEIISTDIDTLDVSDCDEVILFARRNRPTVIINCAGVTNHQYCQDHPEEAYRVNGLGARNVAVAAQLINAQLIHLSTDQVFGQHIDGPCKECDQASPLSIFGKSKLFGEEMVSRVCPHHFIIRTSWLYSNENHMVEKVLEKAKKNEVISISRTAIGSPTSAYALSLFIIQLMKSHEYGVYHASCEGYCSQREFTEKILENAGLTAQLKEVEDYSDQIFRPKSVALENFILNISDIYQFPTWQETLADYMTHNGLM
ncbi:NAD(P)-dependent oxidoreductase [Atopobacter sp. AH10]|uniref:SDR family oxidoreductase n=1 Tax=Atopobacter sp. AH10 TaxID=2315861 RepID=UPI000EF19733|nr:NAD(P)-dependent oxidoreductase [Atopobacter sp. AH10]RLK63356.1 NAD(P)-dependent oxidoreductase [Atopobacter sp. AH10]